MCNKIKVPGKKIKIETDRKKERERDREKEIQTERNNAFYFGLVRRDRNIMSNVTTKIAAATLI